jgi:SAM-dependent methyltransferase
MIPWVPVPSRHRGAEILDAPGADPQLARRSLRDVALANTFLGGTRAVLAELDDVWPTLPARATLLDVGTGAGDISSRARAGAARRGVELETIGLENSPDLAGESRQLNPLAVCGDARCLPFGDRSVDVVICSQVLHHFFDADAQRVLTELDRVARRRVIVSDLHRSWLAAAGIWLASFALAFHPVSRHDGVVSVMRGFSAHELHGLVDAAVGQEPTVHYRLGYRVTASWTPRDSRRAPR